MSTVHLQKDQEHILSNGIEIHLVIDRLVYVSESISLLPDPQLILTLMKGNESFPKQFIVRKDQPLQLGRLSIPAFANELNLSRIHANIIWSDKGASF